MRPASRRALRLAAVWREDRRGGTRGRPCRPAPSASASAREPRVISGRMRRPSPSRTAARSDAIAGGGRGQSAGGDRHQGLPVQRRGFAATTAWRGQRAPPRPVRPVRFPGRAAHERDDLPEPGMPRTSDGRRSWLVAHAWPWLAPALAVCVRDTPALRGFSFREGLAAWRGRPGRGRPSMTAAARKRPVRLMLVTSSAPFAPFPTGDRSPL